MKKYYKGQLKALSDSSVLTFNFIYKNSNKSYSITEHGMRLLSNYGFNTFEINRFINYINNDTNREYFSVQYKKQMDILTKMIKDQLFLTFSSCVLSDIIFELVESKKGTLFAKEIKTGLLFPIKNNNLCVNSMKLSSNLSVSLGLSVPEMHCIETIITTYDPASIDDVESYVCNENSIKKRYSTNSFSTNVELIERREYEVDTDLIVCNRILMYLDILKNIDIEKYNSYMNRYDSLVKRYNKKNSVSIVDINSLLDLENLIKYEIAFSKDKDGNYIYIDKEIDKLMKCINRKNENECISIDELNKMYDLFLRYQDTFDLNNKNILLDKFACLYFYVMKISGIYDINIDECIMNRIILYTKSLYDRNEINNYIKGIDTFIEDMKSIEFVSNSNNEKRKEKNILLKLFRK